jgi:8-oxo-dGTP pyrophosphatase MutT (NUDIX family)
MTRQKNRWNCVAEKTLLASPVMSIVQRDCRSSEDDRPHRFYLMKSRDWCNVIPVTEDGKIVMVRQYRIGISDHTLENPGGVTDPTDPDVQATALREMAEETGYVPLPGARCDTLGWCHPNPAILDNRSHFFIVGPVRRERAQELDPGEMIEVTEFGLDEIPAMILRGEITHSLTLNALFRLTLGAESGQQALRARLAAYTTAR